MQTNIHTHTAYKALRFALRVMSPKLIASNSNTQVRCE